MATGEMHLAAPHQRRRVVVTGLGTVNPLANSVSETWDALVAGRSGIGQITLFDAALSPVKIAGEVKNCTVTEPFSEPLRPSPEKLIERAVETKELKRMGRFSHLGLVAALQAYRDAGLDAVRADLPPDRIGVNIGVGMGGLPEIQSVYDTYRERGFGRITPFFILQVLPNLVSGYLSILLDLQGPNMCNVTACATSAHSLGEAVRSIRNGDADVMIAGGAEAVVCELAIGGFAAMKALSTRNDEPTKASRPFSVDRDGFVMGEGASVLILEEYEFARKRGAQIYGEMLGYGLGSDAYHITSPAPCGVGAGRAMRMALRDAGLNPEQVGYVNAHATSTPGGDAEEIAGIATVFPQGREHLKVSGTKSMTGHLLGAAGATECLISLLAMNKGVIPPTINLEQPDPEIDQFGLDLCPLEPREHRCDYVMSNSFGFGSTNGTLVMGRV
jgi:3-oxoacyl-[acyl-carrier-protein] synthase II